MAVQVMAAMLIAVLFLPAFGPQLDHHFAERRPDHGHLYLGVAAPEHTHSFEGQHIHLHTLAGSEADDVDGSPGGTSRVRIVFLSTAEGLGQGPADLASRAVQRLLEYAHPYVNPLALGMSRSDNILFPVFVTPPWRPPRK